MDEKKEGGRVYKAQLTEKKEEKNVYRAHLTGLPFDINTDLTVVHQDSRGMYVANKPEKYRVPKISIYSDNLSKAYELALVSVWKHGERSSTHYDNPGDPPSKEATVGVNISDPLGEPLIHKFVIGGPQDIESYIMEVVDGIHDHHIDPSSNKWSYTYHERLFNYNPSTNLKAKDRGLLLPNGINQIELILQGFKQDITSRGLQATTWMPSADPALPKTRPCLQRIWFRAYEDENKRVHLNMNSHWRSRDLAGAWFMNVRALTRLQKKVAEDLSNLINQEVLIADYFDISDTLHVYGKDFKFFGPRIETLNTDKDFKNRIIMPGTPQYETYQDWAAEARENLTKDPDYYFKGGK